MTSRLSTDREERRQELQRRVDQETLTPEQRLDEVRRRNAGLRKVRRCSMSNGVSLIHLHRLPALFLAGMLAWFVMCLSVC